MLGRGRLGHDGRQEEQVGGGVRTRGPLTTRGCFGNVGNARGSARIFCGGGLKKEGFVTLWKRKQGITVFTGFVMVPHNNADAEPQQQAETLWDDIDAAKGNIYKLEHGASDHDLAGPRRLVRPEEFLEAMQQYDGD